LKPDFTEDDQLKEEEENRLEFFPDPIKPEELNN